MALSESKYACEHVLQCLKVSRLTFSFQETPYSAYITIRKSFIPVKISNPQFPASPGIAYAHFGKHKSSEEKKLLETRVNDLEVKNENYARDLHIISLKLEKARKELAEVMLEKETSADKSKNPF